MAPHRRPKLVKHKSHTTLYLAIGIIVIVLIFVGAYVAIGQFGSQNTPTPTPTPTVTPTTSPSGADSEYENATQVLLQTSVGNITIELRTDKPITTENFLNLVEQGKYDGTVFHRTVSGFMIQGGAISPQPSAIADEIGNNNRNLPYTIAMAKTNEPDSATSQFFINVADNGVEYAPTFDSTFTVFGKVISGTAVVDEIAEAPATENPYIPGEMSVPVNPVTIIKATILP
jgi:peptidyl-prolyl cis-trans isomerase A (cyclophilin A)